jgi:hypothetical protein
MAYTPREIKDRVAVGDDIFLVEDLGDNRIRLIPAPTHVSEAGTPVNKALLQPIEDYLATGVVPVERTIIAGNGLSGGGSLNADRTLSLGTPSTLSGGTSNSVTGASHTHAISVATQAEAEAGTDNVKLMTPLRVRDAITRAFQVVASGTATLLEGYNWVGLEIPGLGPSPKKLTCFYYATTSEGSPANLVHYACERKFSQGEWKMYVYFYPVFPSDPDRTDVTIDYTIVAWNL